MRNNDNALTCPASFVGESHFDSEALAGGLWEAYRVVGGAMVPIVLDAVALLPDDATMEEMTAAVVAVAGIRGGPSTAAIVEEILAERGLDECARIVEPQQLRRPLFVAPTGLRPYTPAAVQLRVPGGSRLRFTVGAGETIVLAKADAPIEFSYAGSQVSSDATLEVEAAGEVQLPAGDHVYVSFANPGADPVLVTNIAVAVDDDKADRIAPEEDAVVDAAEGCRVGARPPTFAGLVLLLLLGVRERKRRTS